MTDRVRPFSLPVYFAIVAVLSWPFQLLYGLLGPSFRAVLLVSMVMVAVATFISGRFVFKDGFAHAGWRWGAPRHYAGVFGLALLIWLAPVLVEVGLGIREPLTGATGLAIVGAFAWSFALTILPAFGEEFGWRGYMLRHLATRYGARRGLLVHGLVTWLWHVPFLVIVGLEKGGASAAAVLLAASLIPAVLHAVIFAWIWVSTASIAVVVAYHALFDEVRDALQGVVGFGPFVEAWQIVVVSGLGVTLLFGYQWRLTPPPVGNGPTR